MPLPKTSVFCRLDRHCLTCSEVKDGNAENLYLTFRTIPERKAHEVGDNPSTFTVPDLSVTKSNLLFRKISSEGDRVRELRRFALGKLGQSSHLDFWHKRAFQALFSASQKKAFWLLCFSLELSRGFIINFLCIRYTHQPSAGDLSTPLVI